MKKWIVIAVWWALGFGAVGQDLTWLIEQSPAVTMTLAKVLEKVPSFTAGVELEASSKSDPGLGAASGTLEFRDGKMRWQAPLKEIKSDQLTEGARAIVRQVNGDQVLVVTRPDQSANYLILMGAQAYLQQELPSLKLGPARLEARRETISGHLCLKERRSVVHPDGTTNALTVWKAKDLQNLPIQIEMVHSAETFRFRLKDVQFRAVAGERFQVPARFTEYSSMEDLVQSVLLDKVKRRLGLQ